MTKEEAIILVGQVAVSVQKARSNILEFTGTSSLDREINEQLFPHLFGEIGEKWVTAILKMSEKGDKLEPIDVYNLCTIAWRLEPVIAAVAGLRGVTVPEPSISLMHWT